MQLLAKLHEDEDMLEKKTLFCFHLLVHDKYLLLKLLNILCNNHHIF